MRTLFIQIAYIGASALFILGLRSLTRPEKARRGLQQHQAAPPRAHAVDQLPDGIETRHPSNDADPKRVGLQSARP